MVATRSTRSGQSKSALLTTLALLVIASVAAIWWFQDGPPGAGMPNERSLFDADAPDSAHAPDAKAAQAGDRTSLTLAPASTNAAAIPESPESGSITIRLINPDTNQPVRHAIGQALGPLTPTGQPVRRVTVTDERGHLIFESLVAGTWKLNFDRLHVDAWPVTVDLASGQHVERDIVIDEGRETSIQVMLPDGKPAAGASVWLRANTRPHFVAPVCTADREGRARLFRFSSRAGIGASLDPFGPTAMLRPDVQSGERQHITLRLGESGAALRGTVVTPTGQPIPNATVRAGDERLVLRDGRPIWHSPPNEVITDRFGAFAWTSLKVGSTDVTARCSGFAPTGVHVGLQPGSNQLRIVLHEVAEYRLRVADHEGQPLAGASIFLDGLAGHANSNGITDVSGLCVLRSVPSTPFVARVSRTGYGSERILVPAAAGRSDQEHRVVLTPRLGVRGVLVDSEDRPLEGWRLCWTPNSGQATTDAYGRFVLYTRRTEPGVLLIRNVNGYSWFRCDWIGPIRPHAVGPPGTEDELRIVWPSEVPSGTLRGTITDHDGGPFPLRGVTVDRLGLYITPQFSGPARIVEDEDDAPAAAGQFYTRPLAPGRYVLRVWPADERADSLPELRLGPFEVTAGVENNLGTIRAPRPGQLELRIHAPDGAELENPLAFVKSSATSARGAPPLERSVGPGDDGWFRKALPAGHYEVGVHTDNTTWTFEQVTIRAGATTRLERSVRFAQRRLLRFPVPVPAAVASASSIDFTIRNREGHVIVRDSAYSMADLPTRYVPALAPGTYTLEMLVNGTQRYSGRFEAPAHGRSNLAIPIAVTPVR